MTKAAALPPAELLAKMPGATHWVRVPATSANLGVGFDTVGLALDRWNTFAVQRLAEGEAPYLQTLAGSPVQLGPKRGLEAVSQNLFFKALMFYYEQLGRPSPAYGVGVYAEIPLARGLGSSATAVVGAMLAANAIEGHPLDDEALLKLAIAFEGHPDNVAPALLGGCVFGDETRVMRLPWPEDWHSAVWIPEDALLTEAARRVLPELYPRSAVVSALKQSAMLLQAIHTADEDLLAHILEKDVVHEPYRAPLIEGFAAFRAFMHTQAKVLGCMVSGSGSTVLVLYPAVEAPRVREALSAWQSRWGGEACLLPVSAAGASIKALT